MEKYYLAIEIGGTKLQFLVGDYTANIHKSVRLSIDRLRGAAGIRAQIEQTLTSLLPDYPLIAAGIGFGGPVNWQTGEICVSHQIEGWSGFPLAAWLQSLIQVPVFVENDANVAALGEAIHGSGKGYQHVFYVTLGSGVGGGMVSDGQIYHGATPGEAEIGHIRLDRSGSTLESTCSGWAVDQKIRNGITHYPNSPLAKLINQPVGGEASHLKPALAMQDKYAWQILEETTQALAFGLSHAVHLFHPEILVLGGGLSLIGEPLRQAVAHALPTYLMNAFLPGPAVHLAQLGENAVPIGALALATRRFSLTHQT